MTNAQLATKLQPFGQDILFLANVISTQHRNPNRKLNGLYDLLAAGHSVRIAQFSIDTLLINNKQYGWEVLESPKLIINGTWN